jgi:OmpA-OmpF porin, OOP family
MRVGNTNLTVFSSALFCFATFFTGPLEAAPQAEWYTAVFDKFFHAVNSESQAAKTPPKEAARQIEQAYLSRLAKENGTITVGGHVPSANDLKILKGVAAATSPGASVVDNSRVNVNVGDRDTWLAAMTFALRQLSKLQSGTAVLRNTAIVIEGVTKADDDFASVQKKVREEAPKGLYVHVALKPHDVHPFVWLAQLQPGALTLSGHVPDRQDKILCAHAQTLFNNLKVNNSMEFAKGEPQEWLAASKVALEMLSLLYSGSVAISDTTVRIDGVYSSPAIVDLFKSYSKRLPNGFTLQSKVLETVAGAPAARADDVSFAAHESHASMNP